MNLPDKDKAQVATSLHIAGKVMLMGVLIVGPPRSPDQGIMKELSHKSKQLYDYDCTDCKSSTHVTFQEWKEIKDSSWDAHNAFLFKE